jgi:hypothetical protein
VLKTWVEQFFEDFRDDQIMRQLMDFCDKILATDRNARWSQTIKDLANRKVEEVFFFFLLLALKILFFKLF